jgi:Spy/CpxP family protein refolding chaperone
MMAWWKWKHAAHHGNAHCGAGAGAGGPGEGAGEAYAGGDAFDADYGGGSFGVRRPLRFLAHKLDLDEKQVGELAHVLSELKTERAQAAVDHRRTVAGFADVIASEAFDEAQAGAVAAERVKSAERLRDALVKALGRIHALLKPEQRARFAYLIRTGALTL